MVAEYDYSGNLVERYVHGTATAGADADDDGFVTSHGDTEVNPDDPIVWYHGPDVGQGQRRFLIANHQGSIVAVGDGGGNLLAFNRYDEYGIPASGNQGRFQYTGQAWLPELGMYHYKARVYSPTLGRFLQTDPIGYEGGFNLYRYVENDPVNAIDPDGKNPVVALILACIRFCRAIITPVARTVGQLASRAPPPSATLRVVVRPVTPNAAGQTVRTIPTARAAASARPPTLARPVVARSGGRQIYPRQQQRTTAVTESRARMPTEPPRGSRGEPDVNPRGPVQRVVDTVRLVMRLFGNAD